MTRRGEPTATVGAWSTPSCSPVEKPRRLGGADKPGIEIGGVALLGRVVAAVADADTVVVVGPPRVLALSRPVLWCQEEPPGGGPVAALAAGLDVTSAEIVVVLAADLPWIAPAVPDLLAALGPPGRADVAVLTDRAGRRNHLAAAWRRPALVAALAALPAAHGAAMRSLFEDMSVSGWTITGGRARTATPGTMWTTPVAE